jgi:hypothetical protein
MAEGGGPDRARGVLKSRPKMVAMRVKLPKPAGFSEMRCVYWLMSCTPSRFEYLRGREAKCVTRAGYLP